MRNTIIAKAWRRILASLQLFREFTYNNLSSTNSTLCAQPCYCQTVETHSCVSASCQVFATGDFIRQSCLLRRKNASLQVFTEFTYNRIVKRASKRSNKSSVETWRAASLSSGRAAPPLTRTEQTRECPSPAKRWTFFREGSKNYSSSVILEDFFIFIFAWSVNGTGFLLAKSFCGKPVVP